MKVILQKDIPNLGEAGDIKDVSDGYARNFLLPKKLVLVANDSSQKAAVHQRKLIKIKKDKRKKQSETLMETLARPRHPDRRTGGRGGKTLRFRHLHGHRRKLKGLGHEIDRRKIHLDEPIKKLGEYEVPVKLDEGVTAKLKVTVFKE